jgi:hypothetical protein
VRPYGDRTKTFHHTVGELELCYPLRAFGAGSSALSRHPAYTVTHGAAAICVRLGEGVLHVVFESQAATV